LAEKFYAKYKKIFRWQIVFSSKIMGVQAIRKLPIPEDY
jgi:hypothetical protein